MYDRVLFPTDGSEGADLATDHAVEVARRFDAPIHALYVVDVTPAQATDAYAGIALETLEAEGERQLETVSERAGRAGIDVTTAVTEGTPARTIVEAARDGDVIVMGTHGHTGLERYLLGSTTEKVIRTAHVPVVAVPVSMTEPAEE